jgi:hypothetical protein
LPSRISSMIVENSSMQHPVFICDIEESFDEIVVLIVRSFEKAYQDEWKTPCFRSANNIFLHFGNF